MIVISERIRKKLTEKHGGITEDDIVECFSNREGGFLKDTRENHLTDPPTLWFIAETNSGRKLKVCFMKNNDEVIIKTAYEPNEVEKNIYNSKS